MRKSNETRIIDKKIQATVQAEETAGLVNLARLSITRVRASSINGNRPQDNQYYGITNAFDGGRNIINNINYTWWLSSSIPVHWIRVSFAVPVTIHSVVLETTQRYRPGEFAIDIIRASGDAGPVVQYYESTDVIGSRTVYELPESVSDVNEVKLIFSAPGLISVSEIRVMGRAPDGTNLAEQKPGLIPDDVNTVEPRLIQVISAADNSNNIGMTNLARLSMTGVRANLEHSEKTDDPYHGLLNAFDGGQGNIRKNICYSSWSAQKKPSHRVEFSFSQPVTIHSVLLETVYRCRPEEFEIAAARVSGETRLIVYHADSLRVKGFRTAYRLPEPATNINELSLTFSAPDTMQIAEIIIAGNPPEGTDLKPCKPYSIPDERATASWYVKVLRTIRTDRDMELINIAENAYPARTDVIKAIEKAHFKLGGVPEDEKLWWYSSFDKVRLPYAITAEAIEYYRNPFKPSYLSPPEKPWPAKKYSFTYTAEVEFKRRYENEARKFSNVYVVKMQLSLSAYWGPLAALGFYKDRVVVIDERGKVLAIFGDGRTSAVVA